MVTFNFTSWERAPGIQRTGNWVGLGAGLHVVKKKILLPVPGIETALTPIFSH
jgi:hypothetical protein